MVNGKYYGVQYEIYLNKKLDLYNDILPICIDVRKMITLDEKVNKLIIFNYNELDKRLSQNKNI